MKIISEKKANNEALSSVETIMKPNNPFSNFGPPDIEIGTVRFWIHNRQFPDSTDFWDGNWLKATVACEAEGAIVWVSGPILHLSELKNWAAACQQMSETLSGRADLSCIEPNLAIELSLNKMGQLQMDVFLTADHLTQTHHFEFSLDQSDLPNLIRGVRKVLEKFPLREAAP